MQFFSYLKSRLFGLLILSLSLFGVVACELQPANPTTLLDEEPTVEAVVPTPVNTPEPSLNEPIEEDLSTRETTRALSVWVLPEFETNSETPAGNVISQQLATFDANHPEIQLNIEHKSVVGQGGLFDYFST